MSERTRDRRPRDQVAQEAQRGGAGRVNGTRREAFLANLRELAPYLIAGVIFIVAGVADPRFMLNWAPGIALLLVVAWVIPALWKRWRRR